jgi:MscS family membrane protein
MILFDRPFQVGDWIIVGVAEGTVEEIGFRSTRLRTFYNSVISIPNSELMNAKVDNMGRRQYRRLRTTLRLTYDTPPAKLKAFVDGIKEIILKHPQTRKDYFHVVFNDYGPSSLDVMLYMFFEVPDWTEELLAREQVLTDILTLAESIGVSFAFPTQTLHIESMPTAGSSRQ